MSDSRVYEGGCLCGKIRWRASGEKLYAMNCHCRQCNKHTGSAFGTGVGFRQSFRLAMTTKTRISEACRVQGVDLMPSLCRFRR